MPVVDASQLSRRPHALRPKDTIEIPAFGSLGTFGITDRISFAPVLQTLDKATADSAILPAYQIRPAFKIGTIHAPAATRNTAFVRIAVIILTASQIT